MKMCRMLQWMIGFAVAWLLAAPLAPAQEGQDDYSREQLTQMLAPIALYPDALLSQVLMAATYPLEVVEAERWVRQNPQLSGEQLDEALQSLDWDASVKALCHVPTILQLMSTRLDETTNLGNAFLAQEGEVMEVVQALRSRAYQEGNLRSNDKQKVTLLADGTIVIAPAEPQTVYVPYYDTSHVYGSWWYPDWPPWYWGPAGIMAGSGIYFWPDAFIDFSFGLGFGYWCAFDWPHRTIIIDDRRRPRFFRPDYDWRSRRGVWRHEPSHRRGVVYRDRPTAERFGQFRERDRVFNRAERGFPAPNQAGQPGAASSGSRVVPPAPRPPAPAPLTRSPRETLRREGPPARGEGISIFGGGQNSREEGRSSSRGRSSREAMPHRTPRGGSSPAGRQGGERGGGSEHFRR